MPPAQSELNRLKRLVPRMRGKRVGVVGDLMLDRYLWGTAARLSPEAPVPLINYEREHACLGGAGNVAANLAALGARVEAFGALGNDEAGRTIRKDLQAATIGDRGVPTDPRRLTTVKTRIIAGHQHIVRIDRERREPLRRETEEKVLRTLFTALRSLDALILSDYAKGVIRDELADRVLSAANQLNVPVFIAPKRSQLYAHRGSRMIVCNLGEASGFLARPLLDEKSVVEAGAALLPHFGCKSIVITRGDQGMTVYDESWSKPLHIRATSFEITYARVGRPGVEHGATGRQVFDVTGAGDTVLAVLALASVAGAALADAALLANTAAGVVVGKLGTATLTAAELTRALSDLRT
jgi:rfaE bifunctional protein kinase chain/domain